MMEQERKYLLRKLVENEDGTREVLSSIAGDEEVIKASLHVGDKEYNDVVEVSIMLIKDDRFELEQCFVDVYDDHIEIYSYRWGNEYTIYSKKRG